MKHLTLSKIFGAVVVILVGGFLLLQLVPYGRNHTNPAVIAEPAWDSPETRARFMQSCGDCHSNETRWPWYSNIAPISWLVYRDVVEGREKLNVSEWGLGREQEAEDAAELVQQGKMPVPIYLALHAEARLDAGRKQALVNGLARTFGSEIGQEGEEDDD